MSFIVCVSRKSNPRVSVEMCLKCRRAAVCESYRSYREPFLFREMGRPSVKTKRKRVRSGIEQKVTKEQVQEQASFLISDRRLY
jgi:hypothetical protein